MSGGTVISGIGLVSALGNDAGAVGDKLLSGEAGGRTDGAVPFTLAMPSSKLRGVSRYSKLALCATLSAQADAGIDIDAERASRYGTIYTTGYGAMAANVEFGKSVAARDPDLCSPMLFAETVPNCCVGQVCMRMKLKGPSTVMVGGNALFYSKRLIESGRADVVFAGAVEEYSEHLFGSLRNNEYAKDIDVREATVVFVLEKDSARKAPYCGIGNSASGGLSGYPLIKGVDGEKSRMIIARAVKKCAGDKEICAVYTSANSGYFDEMEESVIAENFPGADIVRNVKALFGETMGASFNVNVAAAALSFNSTARKNVLVTGYDPIGNYHCIILERRGD
ncbi:MAG: hypothetical protein FWC23_00785 [Chitinispirillia bacterium]|nr:hypothetical protein [Chitinispirillia bacterium]MCL2267711.1 hypothetical protein [Chitinispirillia bacterium]